MNSKIGFTDDPILTLSPLNCDGDVITNNDLIISVVPHNAGSYCMNISISDCNLYDQYIRNRTRGLICKMYDIVQSAMCTIVGGVDHPCQGASECQSYSNNNHDDPEWMLYHNLSFWGNMQNIMNVQSAEL